VAAKSRRKGANGEREFRDVVREFGFDCERDGQTTSRRFLGAANLDLRHTVPGVHMEVKRRETYGIDAWLSQAEVDAARECKEPWVCFRKSKQPWRVIVNARWLLGLMRELVDLREERDWLVSRIDTRYADDYIERSHAK
jgi:hypothetical protein